jgi:hypothetical protein
MPGAGIIPVPESELTHMPSVTNYDINPNLNRLGKSVFSLPEALSLLDSFDILLQ